MIERTQTFFLKNQIHPVHILYLCREEGKSVITMKDGKTFETYIPAKKIALLLPEEDFVSINKGIYVNRHSITNITDGYYTMADGRVFQGRVRTTGEHRKLQRELYRKKSAAIRKASGTSDNCSAFSERYAAFDELPVAVCIIELVFDEDNNPCDFMYRYGNKKLAALCDLFAPGNALIGKTFIDYFENGDPKWINAYSQTALHGGEVTISDYSEELGQNVRVYCYQPEPGLCGCIVIPENL